MDIQATLLCDWISIWIFHLHSPDPMIGLLSGYSSWTALCFAFLLGYLRYTPMWLASYMHIQAKILLICILPGYSSCAPVWLASKPGFSSCTVLWLASYLDIPAASLYDWPPNWKFKLDFSLLCLPTWIFKLYSSVHGLIPGYSSWFSKDYSSFPFLCWSISYNLNKAGILCNDVLPGYLRCPPLWLVGWGQSLNCFLSWRVPVNTILVKT